MAFLRLFMTKHVPHAWFSAILMCLSSTKAHRAMLKSSASPHWEKLVNGLSDTKKEIDILRLNDYQTIERCVYTYIHINLYTPIHIYIYICIY